MEVKKSQKADLENKRGLFLEIGLALTLIFVFLAFEWRVDTSEVGVLDTEEEVFAEEEMVPITRQEPVKPPPPKAPTPKVSEILDIVDDNEDFEDELEIEDSEADPDADVYSDIGEEAEAYDEPTVFVIVEDMPEFPGGNRELQKWLARNVVYPQIASENGITGRVYVGFIVNELGDIEDVKVTRGVDQSLDQEAVRVIKKMPRWKPGKQRGKPVKVSYTVPINFQLR